MASYVYPFMIIASIAISASGSCIPLGGICEQGTRIGVCCEGTCSKIDGDGRSKRCAWDGGNYCGSWIDVPEYAIPLPAYVNLPGLIQALECRPLPYFGDACRIHDRCYEDCNRNQDYCDKQFLQNLKAICQAKPTAQNTGALGSCNASCSAMATVYYTVVDKLGRLSFEKDRGKCSTWKPCCPDDLTHCGYELLGRGGCSSQLQPNYRYQCHGLGSDPTSLGGCAECITPPEGHVFCRTAEPRRDISGGGPLQEPDSDYMNL